MVRGSATYRRRAKGGLRQGWRPHSDEDPDAQVQRLPCYPTSSNLERRSASTRSDPQQRECPLEAGWSVREIRSAEAFLAPHQKVRTFRGRPQSGLPPLSAACGGDDAEPLVL
jgi:hypothetical protein